MISNKLKCPSRASVDRSITHSTRNLKSPFCQPEISFVACEINSIKVDFSDYPNSLISRINEVYVFFSI